MTLEGPQIAPCDECQKVEEIRLSGGMELCDTCRTTRCPRCGEFQGTWDDEYGIYSCRNCSGSYHYKGD